MGKYTRILRYAFAQSLQGARLDAYCEQQTGERLDVVLDLHVFERAAPAELFEDGGKIYERLQGYFTPARLRFSGVEDLYRGDFFTRLEHFSPQEPSRTLVDLLSWRQPDRQMPFYLLWMKGQEDAEQSSVNDLQCFARRVTCKCLHLPTPLTGDYDGCSLSASTTIERDWSSPPPMPGRIVPQPQFLHCHFGGDPITVWLDSQVYPRRLFIGRLETQTDALYPRDQRPDVAAVLNLGEEPSRWALRPADRWENKGEGSNGMGVDEIRQEAEWVLERLRTGQRVLVHCVAGMNRSATICCAVLILLEGLSAGQALERVRQHHPWARPDGHHWLKLRWLAVHDQKKEVSL